MIPDLTLLVKFTTPDGYNWVGYGLPGDSGSEVMNDAGLAVGDLTHGIGIAASRCRASASAPTGARSSR